MQLRISTAIQALGLLFAAGAPGIAAAGEAANPPNIVYVLADELGYYELGCMGHPNFMTPNLDRLAAEGIRFTQALAGASVCAPTRCCLMTGKHAGHTSVRLNDGGTPLREGEETIATILKRAGYATGGFGKWGCGGRGSTGVPEKHGFDLFVGYYDQVHAHTYYPAYIVRNSEKMPLAGNAGGRSGATYSHYAIVGEATKFIRANKDRRFFCYLPLTPPHGMFDIPEDDPSWSLFKEKPWPTDAKRYAAMVHMLDRHVGEVVALLKELGLDRSTIIFFSGDNGGLDYFRDKDHPRGFHAPNVDPKTGIAFRGEKGTLYEGGLRVPMIVRWPGRIQAGRVSDHPWYFPDVMATLAELTGASPPAEARADGISIVPELLGEIAAGRKQEVHPFFYWEFGGQTAVRMGQWKAIQPGAKAPWELYDLTSDIEEKKDLAGQKPDILATMRAYAQQAHEPVREGAFLDRAPHEEDREAKWGKEGPPAMVMAMPPEGLIPNGAWRIARVSSESRANGKLAANAIDGDPRTWWHSAFQGGALPHPHELVIDLGAEHTIRGFRYLARQDAGWNGTLKECEFCVSADPARFGEPVARAQFKKVKRAQDAPCAPVRGRYVLLRSRSAQDGGPWASAAEIGVIGE